MEVKNGKWPFKQVEQFEMEKNDVMQDFQFIQAVWSSDKREVNTLPDTWLNLADSYSQTHLGLSAWAEHIMMDDFKRRPQMRATLCGVAKATHKYWDTLGDVKVFPLFISIGYHLHAVLHLPH